MAETDAGKTRNLVICCDGTWNSIKNRDNGLLAPTNVVRLHAEIDTAKTTGVEQIRYYRSGVGTTGSVFRKLLGGALGWGLENDIKSAYKWWADNWRPGEDRIFIFGFSRGAYTARSLAAMITSIGRIEGYTEVQDTAERWRLATRALERYMEGKTGRGSGAFGAPNVHFLGVWDTVGALGIPEDFALLRRFLPRRLDTKYIFPNTDLSPKVDHARHAVAMDEMRIDYAPTLWTEPPAGRDATRQTFEQRWFPGVHGDLGGGYFHRGLADRTLEWMMMEAGNQGLVYRKDAFRRLSPDPRGLLHDSATGVFLLRRTRPRPVPSLQSASSGRIDRDGLERHAHPAPAETHYWKTLVPLKGSPAEVRVYAGVRWNRTGLYLEPGDYEMSGSGEWLDGSIKASADGPKPGFNIWKAAYWLAALYEWPREAVRSWSGNSQAELPFFRVGRRVFGLPWFGLIGVVADGDGADNKSKHLIEHQTFHISDAKVRITVKKGGYLWCFANDAWAFNFNNHGSLALTVERV